MEIVVGGRRTGKTHGLVEAAVAAKLRGENAVIISASAGDAETMKEKVREVLVQHKLTRPDAVRKASEIVRCVTSNWLYGQPGTRSIYIDDFELVLARALGCAPNELTILTENAPVRTPQGERFKPYPAEKTHPVR